MVLKMAGRLSYNRRKRYSYCGSLRGSQMEQFRLCLLGPFQALLDGKPIAGFESDKSRALLAYLATESGRPHGREVLAELLWPERPQGAALANLRHTLADVRTAIGDHAAEQPCLLVSHATLQFDPTAAFVDVARFSTLLSGGAAASVAACQEAIDLYGGQFLHGFSLDDSPEFEAWLLLQRERFDHQAAQALARLVRCCVEQGSYAEAAHVDAAAARTRALGRRRAPPVDLAAGTERSAWRRAAPIRSLCARARRRVRGASARGHPRPGPTHPRRRKRPWPIPRPQT